MRVAVLVLVALAVAVSADTAQRKHHSTKAAERCRYVKGTWSPCEPTSGSSSGTGLRSRTLTLKKGDPATCERTKTIQKKCKKTCRYEKSPWSVCGPDGEMRRVITLRAGSDPGCEPRRSLTRKCSHHDLGRRSRD